jgi:hypothetical protein
MGNALTLVGSINVPVNLNVHPKSPKSKRKVYSKLRDTAQTFDVTVLPVSKTFEIQNLYNGKKDTEWNILICGNDKTYIFSKTRFVEESLENTKGDVLPTKLYNFFDGIQTHALNGESLQFLIVYDKQTYLVNTFPLKHESKVLGTSIFVRNSW